MAEFSPESGSVHMSKADAAPMTLDIEEKANATGSYEFLGEAFFVDDIIDPGIVRRIREFAPTYVPLLVKRRYRSPANTEIEAVYHVIGRYIENPEEYFRDSTVKLAHVPHDFPFPPDMIHPLRTLWAPWKAPNEDGEGSPPDLEWTISAPPGYVKPEAWLVDTMRALNSALEMQVTLATDENGELHQTTKGQRDFMVDKIKEIVDREDKKDEKIRAEAMAEARYRMRHNWPQLKAAADKEQWSDPEPPASPAPFMDLGGK